MLRKRKKESCLEKVNNCKNVLKIHGESAWRGHKCSPEYNSWYSMITRCHNKNCGEYRRYGALGVVVCTRWRESFVNFLSDIGRKPSPEHSLDRIDPFGNYCAENCRWATKSEQARNRRNSVKIEYDGMRVSVYDLAESFNIFPSTLLKRLKLGWSIHKALTTPVRGHNKNLKETVRHAHGIKEEEVEVARKRSGLKKRR